MPLTAYIIDFNDLELIEQDMPDDSSELNEFLDHPSCGLRRDGTCSDGRSYFCVNVCRHGETGGVG